MLFICFATHFKIIYATLVKAQNTLKIECNVYINVRKAQKPCNYLVNVPLSIVSGASYKEQAADDVGLMRKRAR